MIKAVIFDCFGVLVSGAFEEVYSRAGGNPQKDAKFIDDLLGQSNLGVITPDEMRDKIAAQIGITPKRWQEEIARIQLPSNELLAFATSLKDRYKIAILSNANEGTLQRKFSLEQLAIFDAVIVSAEVHFIKPQPEIYILAAKRLGVDTTECIFIDDNPGFCDAAKICGMQAICYKNFQQFKTDIGPLITPSMI